MDDAKVINERLHSINSKLDDHGKILERLSDALSTIARQTEKLNSLQAQQNELRGDVNHLEAQILPIVTHQAGCPRRSVDKLWGMLWAMVIVLLGTFVTHLLKTP